MSHKLYINNVPKCITEVIGNKFFIKSIISCIDNGHMPNLLLFGGAGIGKKMLAKLIAKYYGGETKVIDASIYKSKDIVVVNSADKDGIPCINITTFAKAKNKAEFDYKKKVIIITNFDEMTREAQNALRSIIEKYSELTRFILTSNDLNGIIEPLQSRFNIFCIKPLSSKNIKLVINNLIDIPLCPKVINLIIMITDGDIKQIINYVQAISSGYTGITVAIFTEIFKLPDISIIKSLIKEIFIHKKYDSLAVLLKSYDPQMIMTMFTKLLIKYYDAGKYSITPAAINYTFKLNLKLCNTEKEISINIISLINKLIIL